MRKMRVAALAVGTGLVGLVGSAQAALTLPGSLPITDAEAAAALVVTVVTGIWVIRKAIAFFGGR